MIKKLESGLEKARRVFFSWLVVMTSNKGGFLEGKEIVLKGRDVKILGILKSSEVNFDKKKNPSRVLYKMEIQIFGSEN